MRHQKGRRGVSLNDCLHVGPPLAPLLFDVLLRLRTYKVVLIGDIQQAFLNIEVAKEDRDAMRFLWYSDICTRDGTIDVYRFCRVIFGAGPSPFLLNGTLRRHIEKYKKENPEFELVESFYVDDLAIGSHSECDAFHLYQKIKNRMAEGGFVLRKWKSNSQEFVAMTEKAENSAQKASEDPHMLKQHLEIWGEKVTKFLEFLGTEKMMCSDSPWKNLWRDQRLKRLPKEQYWV